MSKNVAAQTRFDYAIVGGGSMGVSVALALQKHSRQAKVILIKGKARSAASKGMCRIIRTPYMDNEYVRLAESAKEKWENELPYCNHYRRTGWVQEVNGNEYVPFHSEERQITVEELVNMVGSHGFPQVDPQKELWFNNDIGVADAALAVEAVSVEAAACGVIIEEGDVSRLLVMDDVCYGVEHTNGTEIRADATIVAAESWTPALLKSSKIAFKDDFFTSTATIVATVSLTKAESERFNNMPILTADQGKSNSSSFLYLDLKLMTYRRNYVPSYCS